MAKIPNGILGSVRGKVGGAVGANWKGVSYIRAYAKPGYSRTDAQAAQRDAMAYLVAAAKPFVSRIFFTYTDKFLSKLSGFNWVIRENMADVQANDIAAHLKVCSGPLYPGSGLAGANAAGTVTVSWAAGNGVDGADTDVAIAWVRNNLTNAVVFGANTTRVTHTSVIVAPPFDVVGDLDVGVFFARMNASGDVCQRVSTNLTGSVT